MLSLGFNSRVVKFALLVVGLGIASAAVAQSARQAQISERLAPVGQVCLAGEPCASAAGGSAGAAASAGGADAGAFNVTGAYDQYCAMCHGTGMAGAPLRGDADHWTARLADVGIDTVVTNAIDGINAMPPRGMCNTCSDEEIAELVDHLIDE